MSSDTDTYNSDSEESVKKVIELWPSKTDKPAEKLTVHAIRPGHRARQLHRIGKEFEFKVSLNGRNIIEILDTENPISILPKKYRTEVRPKRVIGRASSRRFVSDQSKLGERKTEKLVPGSRKRKNSDLDSRIDENTDYGH